MGKMNPLMEENGLMEFKVGGPPLLDKMDIMESLAPLNFYFKAKGNCCLNRLNVVSKMKCAFHRRILHFRKGRGTLISQPLVCNQSTQGQSILLRFTLVLQSARQIAFIPSCPLRERECRGFSKRGNKWEEEGKTPRNWCRGDAREALPPFAPFSPQSLAV